MHRSISRVFTRCARMHAMNADELAALEWLLRGRGKERNGIIYNTPDGPQVGYESSLPPGLAALLRVLNGEAPLNLHIRKALARALEPVGVSEMKFTLRLERRKGRGRPRKDVKASYDAEKQTNKINAGTADGTKQEAVIAGEPGSRSKKFAQMRLVREVRERK
jgi:hypothetical protein